MFPPARIETARLRLRPFAPPDLGAVHRMWTEPGMRRYLFDDEVISLERAEEEIAASEARFAAGGAGLWLAFLAEEEESAGFAGYRCFHEPPELQLLYGFTTPHWGRGLATEVSRAMIRCGFETLGLDRIVASADAPNSASLRVMEKSGMAFEKRLSIHGLDTVYYVLERERWTLDSAPYRLVTG